MEEHYNDKQIVAEIVLSVCLYYDYPCSNTADVSTFLGKMLIENNGNKTKRTRGRAI